jgi:hypothetical protein
MAQTSLQPDASRGFESYAFQSQCGISYPVDCIGSIFKYFQLILFITVEFFSVKVSFHACSVVVVSRQLFMN